ncbi:MAG: diheme cytochrome c [Gammaproteobacteria bacterium]|nr:diheme cytochrome c [Gammaproteobacteria bacterium]
MNNKMILGAVLTSLLATTGVVMSDDDHNEHEHRSGFFSRFFTAAGVEPVNNQQYKDECGSCHFAFQPGLLPGRSWVKMMSELENHFGENAELDAADNKQILDYLVAGSSEKSNYRRSQKINNSIRNSSTPLRISETPYFIRKHDELPARYVQGNPKVLSLSNCEKCHTTADEGSYSESRINIPGVGRWDD